MALELLPGVIALELLPETRREQPAADAVVEHRDVVEIAFDGIAAELDESRLGAQGARRPVELGIDVAHGAEQRTANAVGQEPAQSLLGLMPAIAAGAA